jgi:hypothetical protein
MTMKRPLVLLGLALSGCGTYSTLRPATVAPPGHVELGAGLAANQLGEVLPVLDGRAGIFPRVEIGGHYEVYSGFAEARVQALAQETAGVSLALGLGGGFGTTLIDEVGEALDGAEDPDPAVFASLGISRRFGVVEPYVAVRSAALLGTGFVNAPTGGLTFHLGRHVGISLEGGASIHTREGASLAIAQGALGVSLKL